MTRPENRHLEIYTDGLGAGGFEFLLLDLLPTLKKRFDRVELIALHGATGLEDRLESLVSVTRVSGLQMVRRLWCSRATCHVNLARPQMLASLVAMARFIVRRPRANRVVCHEHASLEYFTGRRGFKGLPDLIYRRIIEASLRRGLYGYIVSTRSRLAAVQRIAANESDIIIVPNSVSADRMASLMASRNPDRLERSDAHRFFTLSRMHEVKQVDWAIDAVADLALQFPGQRFELKLCGDGPERPALQARASRLTMPNLRVEFPGFVASMEPVARASDCFLFSSRTEGFPLGLTEALLTGITAVSTNCPHGPADLGEFFPNLYLATPPTHDTFVQAVRRAFDDHRAGWTEGPPPGGWPTAEELADRIASFLNHAPSLGPSDAVPSTKLPTGV
jgi:glycosyltransferase involved in cell wall biosynthesis